MSRPHGQFSSSNQRRKGRPEWTDRDRRVIPDGFPPHRLLLHEAGCTVRPVMALSPYGSGVYIAGMTPMPGHTLVLRAVCEMAVGLQRGVPTHPMPFINYSLTPRF